MFYLLIGLMLIVGCFFISDKKDTLWRYAPLTLFIIAIIFVSLDLYYIYQGEVISNYYNSGEGILYKDLRTHENGTEYYVNIQMYDYHDTTVGSYLAWQKTDHELMKLLGPILFGSIGIIGLFVIYYYLKKMKLIGGA